MFMQNKAFFTILSRSFFFLDEMWNSRVSQKCPYQLLFWP
jgi:hypothetical protein